MAISIRRREFICALGSAAVLLAGRAQQLCYSAGPSRSFSVHERINQTESRVAQNREAFKEPYETAVAVKKAAVDIAKANLEMAEASVPSIETKARRPVLGTSCQLGSHPVIPV